MLHKFKFIRRFQLGYRSKIIIIIIIIIIVKIIV